jgi:septal ring factor EnvC (AmiA/AmiB activator)
MMYSQQEFEMVRRQTIQIEAEKRAFLRLALTVISALFLASLLLLTVLYRNYSAADDKFQTAETRAKEFELKFQTTSRELAEKNAIVDKINERAAKQNAVITSITQKMIDRNATVDELASLAHAVYQQPGHSIPLPSIPPDNVLRNYKIRIDNRMHTYVLIAGQIDGRWVLYSNLLLLRKAE